MRTAPQTMNDSRTTIKDTTGLPTPAERPEADIVIFDGQCVFCRGSVERLHRWDGGRRLAFLSLHSPEVAERWPELSHEQMMREMYVITHDGRKYAGARAFRYLTRRLPRLWPLAPVMHLPLSLPLWQFLYLRVAAWRYRIAGRQCADDSCKVHFDR
ncbi:MAG: DUF393 domain-containing protein [Planctomycetales bacterium]|nr:DUF393 domain-containing protein [Planctomycetales bacterium]